MENQQQVGFKRRLNDLVDMNSSTGPTSTGSTSTLLPEIRTMSPFAPISIAKQQTNDSAITASSITSHDSFMTALTSTSPTSPLPSRLTVTTPHSLRKSVSVDSFISARRSPDLSEPGPSSINQTRDYTRARGAFTANHGITVQSVDSSYASTSSDTNGRHVQSPRNDSFTPRILGRARGHSLSGPSATEYDDPYLNDSEHERTSDIAHLPMLSSSQYTQSSSGRMNGSFKGKSRARPGDALLLPPRSQALSTASSISSFNTATTFTTISSSTIPAVSSLPPNRSRRPTPGALILPRVRSESLSTNPSRSSVESDITGFTIAVIGATSVGKTTLIKKGLKGWFDGDEIIHTVSTPYGKIRYGMRTIIPSRSDPTPSHVLEVDINQLPLDVPKGAWPDALPAIDGAFVVYDATNAASFMKVLDLLAYFHEVNKSRMLIACKSEPESSRKVPPEIVSERSQQFNAGLVEVSSITDRGKSKMRQAFHYLIRQIGKARRGDIPKDYYNPASPELLNGPWSESLYNEPRNGHVRSHVNVQTADSPPIRFSPHVPPIRTSPTPPGASTPTPRTPSVPTSPTRVKSHNDLMSEVERGRHEGRNSEGRSARSTSLSHLQDSSQTALLEANVNGTHDREASHESNTKTGKNNDPPAVPWATLDELLDKLFFLAVSGDDPTFIKHFCLTYRKFATPYSVLLGMQKCIRQLSQETSEPILSSYAQMRICDLLVEWISTYPNDFVSPGAHSAVSALVKQISSNPTTIHYASDIVSYLDDLPHLEDPDASWGLPSERIQGESDEELFGEGYDEGVIYAVAQINDSSTAVDSSVNDLINNTNRPKANGTPDRNPPLSSNSIISTPVVSPSGTTLDGSRSTPKGIRSTPYSSPKALVKVAQTIAACNPVEVAEQITKMQSELFMQIEPRQWLRYAMGDPKPDPSTDPICACATLYNQLAYWVSSLIVAHDKVKAREKQVERFVELAKILRTMNNYVGLRAIITGINNATFQNDEIMTMFKESKLRSYQLYLGYGVLMNSQHNHRAYRLALRHTVGAAIPDMEVHTFDIVRAHESNINHNPDDPSKIHWGKFTLLGKMITMLQGLQDKIRTSGAHNFPERPFIRQQVEYEVMDTETIQSRVFPPPEDAEPLHPLSQPPMAQVLDSPNMPRNDSRMKRLFFWSNTS